MALFRIPYLSKCSIQLQFRAYASQASPAKKRRLNVPIDFETTPLLHHSQETFANTPGLPQDGPSTRMNLYQSVNSGLRTALSSSSKVLCFGEDVAFGGVFRCTMNLQSEFGRDRVFNTPITEQGIVGAAIGAAAEGAKPVVEIQFADYVFPAFDQIVNEASKFRYREGHTGCNLGGMVIRMPCGGVGHGALYITIGPVHISFCAYFSNPGTTLNLLSLFSATYRVLELLCPVRQPKQKVFFYLPFSNQRIR
jgi:2-oxoisovalerate dehydrogenase E1 component beta subunit